MACVIAREAADRALAVTEMALLLWRSDVIVKIVTAHAVAAFPVIVPNIYKSTSRHWIANTQGLAVTALTVLKGCDQAVLERV